MVSSSIYIPILAFTSLVALQSPAAPKKGGNPEAAKIKNPVAATAESIAAGKRESTRRRDVPHV